MASRLDEVLEEIRQKNGFTAVLVANEDGLVLGYAGDLAHEGHGVAGLIPDLIRMSERVGKYADFGTVAMASLVFENPTRMVVARKVEADAANAKHRIFLLVDTAKTFPGLGGEVKRLGQEIMQVVSMATGGSKNDE